MEKNYYNKLNIKRFIFFITFIAALHFLFSGNSYIDFFSSGNINNDDLSINSSPRTFKDSNFVIGAINSGWDVYFEYIPRDLSFNLWHIYTGLDSDKTGRHYPSGWTHDVYAPADILFDKNQNDYLSQVNVILDNIRKHNMQALIMRPKLEWLFFGQRSDYQCEPVTSGDRWFYSFNDHLTGVPETDSGQGVIHCRALVEEGNNDTPGIVVKHLKANAEQCNQSGTYHGDNECDWLIKPRIRIDPSFTSNRDNWNTNVCRIIVIGQSGADTLKSVDIKVKNFLNVEKYDGRYLEEFYNFQTNENLRIHGAWGNLWNFAARGENNNEDSVINHADIQVFWYGNCDMWIDYIRVDNDVANDLLADPPNPNTLQYMQWIEQEANQIAGNNCDALYNFYLELFEFNNIPCMKYVTHKLDSIIYNHCYKHISLMCIFVPFFYAAHVPWNDRLRVQNVEHIKNNFIDDIGVNQFMLAAYPFNSAYAFPEPANYYTWTEIPNTLPNHTGPGTLAKVVPPDEYEKWLQNYLDSVPYIFEQGFNGGNRNPTTNDPGSFRYTMQLGDELSKATGKPFILNPQIHLWFCKCGANFTNPDSGITGEVQREPTNEEINLITNMAIGYGVRGLIYFQFMSIDSSIGSSFYGRGIMEPWSQSKGLQPRYFNIYNQPKYQNLISISQRMRHWEKYIMSFNDNDRHSYIYRLENERNAFLSTTYFNNVSTFPPLENISNKRTMKPDSLNNTYLQVSVFKNDEMNTYYFMLVNRRCSPYRPDLNENGGRRFIRINFDINSDSFSLFHTWQIVDVYDNSVVKTFNKKANKPIDLGWFMPGEGKLYKIIPQIQMGPVSVNK